jgi:hypothetical protein
VAAAVVRGEGFGRTVTVSVEVSITVAVTCSGLAVTVTVCSTVSVVTPGEPVLVFDELSEAPMPMPIKSATTPVATGSTQARRHQGLPPFDVPLGGGGSGDPGVHPGGPGGCCGGGGDCWLIRSVPVTGESRAHPCMRIMVPNRDRGKPFGGIQRESQSSRSYTIRVKHPPLRQAGRVREVDVVLPAPIFTPVRLQQLAQSASAADNPRPCAVADRHGPS